MIKKVLTCMAERYNGAEFRPQQRDFRNSQKFNPFLSNASNSLWQGLSFNPKRANVEIISWEEAQKLCDKNFQRKLSEIAQERDNFTQDTAKKK